MVVCGGSILCGSGGYRYIYDSACTRSGFPHCNLRQWCFPFHPMAQIPSLCSGNLHCVVVFLGGGGGCIRVCGGGGCCYGVLVLGKCAGVSQRKY